MLRSVITWLTAGAETRRHRRWTLDEQAAWAAALRVRVMADPAARARLEQLERLQPFALRPGAFALPPGPIWGWTWADHRGSWFLEAGSAVAERIIPAAELQDYWASARAASRSSA